MRKGIFVSATGTDVGKTYLSALILKGLQELGINAGYFKAALSGAIPSPDGLVPGDAKYVCDIAGLSCPPASLVPYIYETAVSPHLAAQKEGNPLDLQRVKEAFEEASKKFDYLLCEGSGGVICPLRYDASHKIFLTDIMRLTGFPVLLVSPSGLGAINAAVLSARYLEQEGIPVLGFLLNGYEEGNFLHEDNRHMIEELSGLPVIGHAAFQAKTLEESLLKYLLWPSQNGFIC